MFEYHGWVTVQASAGDEETAERAAAVARVTERLSSLKGGSGLADLRWVNGMAQVHLGGFLNHRAGEGQTVVDLFAGVGQDAPGSYGLLYIRDDEDPNGRVNEFQVLVMRRGKVTVHPDAFLSPCIPIIEDED